MPSGNGPGLGRKEIAQSPETEIDAVQQQEQEAAAIEPDQKPSED